MPPPPDPARETTNDRLTRELARMQLRDMGLWGGWALLCGVLALYAFFALNNVQNVRFVEGVARDTVPLVGEDRTILVTRVSVEGQLRDIRLPSQLIHPAKGEVICLRAGEHRLTGHTSYVPVSTTLCEGATATSGDA